MSTDPKHRTAPTLEGDRVLLRHFRKADFPAHHAIVGDPLVMGQLGAPPLGTEDAWRRCAASVGMWDLMGFGGWAVLRRADDRLIGTVGLFNAWRAMEPEFGEAPEMGWIFAREVHGQGLAGEACRVALAWADANLLPTPIWAIVAPGNAPSLRLAERLGFERFADSLYTDEPTAVLKRRARGA